MLVGGGMRSLVLGLPDIDEADYFATPVSALMEKPDGVGLVLVDFFIPGYLASEWLPKLKAHFADAVLVVVSSSLSRFDRDISARAGAVAFIEKHQHPEQLLEQLSKLIAGEAATPTQPKDPTGRLSPKQLDILVELTRGLQSKAIARHMGVSPETVKTHLSRLYRAIEVRGREEAVEWAHRNGII